jgi:hypothetical protein
MSLSFDRFKLIPDGLEIRDTLELLCAKPEA